MTSLMAMNPYFFAEWCHDAYGSEYFYGQCEDCECEKLQQAYDCEECPYDDRPVVGVVCPCCGEPIYFEDWSNQDTKNWTVCPICDFDDMNEPDSEREEI